MEKLRERHQELDAHFRSEPHGEPLGLPHRYLIDHGLGEQELAPLREQVRLCLQSRPLTSFAWEAAYLPLLICAVEVGYEYQGNGTDFWPKLSDSIAYKCDAEDRERISSWFARAGADYGTATPGDSQWERAFRHIAWPITHAVASRDIRRPFADCLRQFRSDVRNRALDDSEIVSELSRISTPAGSRRFRTWLGRPLVVAGIVRDLLGGTPLDEAGLFSKAFRGRLIKDLRSEPDIRMAVRQAEAALLRAPKVRTSKDVAKKAAEINVGSLFLCGDEHAGFELCGEMPELPGAVRRALKAIRGKWKARPWGFPKAQPIPADCFRSNRGQFQVSFRYAAKAESSDSFFTGVEELPVDDEAKRWLMSVRFPAAAMLAFSPMTLGDDSTHVITERRPQRGMLWVLSRRGTVESKWAEGDDSYCRKVACLEDGEIHEFEADNPVVREWLGWPLTNAEQSEESKCHAWIHPSPLRIESADHPMFTTGDQIGISVQGDSPVTVVLRHGAKEVAREVVSAVATSRIECKGNYSLAVVRDEQEIDSFRFGIVNDQEAAFVEPAATPPLRTRMSHVDAGETELTRGDFFNRRLVLDVDSERGIDNLNVKLSLNPGEAVACVALGRTPARLNANHPVWEDLLRQLPVSVLRSPCDLSLTVEIEGISCESWRLEAELQELWWDVGEGGLPIAVSDAAEFRVRHYCLVDDKVFDEPTKGDPFVSVASDLTGNEFDFDARVGLLGDGSLARSPCPPKRFLREFDQVGDIPGLRQIARRYLQVSTATSSSFTAEINRVGVAHTLRTWVLRSLCGPNWFHQHEGLRVIESTHPVAVWWECQLAERDLLQPHTEEDRPLPVSLPELMIREFADALPQQWWDGPVAELDDDAAIPLDSIYQHLLDDESVIVDAETLSRTLRVANERLCGGVLADLIVPVLGGDELLRWKISEMAVSDLASELHLWTRRHLDRGRGRQSWTADELGMYLSLLLYPERLRREPWESILEKLLQDRCVARAGAFVCWRVQQNARLASAVACAETTGR